MNAETDKWRVVDHDNDGNTRTFDSRSDAEAAAEQVRDLGSTDVEVIEPETDTNDAPAEPEVVDHAPAADDAPDTDHEPEVMSPEEVKRAADQLPDERHVDEDPLKWLPGEFVDRIDGSPAINRKGFEVLRFFYDVSLDMEMEVDPNDNDMTHCRYKCVATMDGEPVEAWGTSHVDRGDDPWLLVEMAATRARKRALSIATGAGAVAVEELINDPEGGA